MYDSGAESFAYFMRAEPMQANIYMQRSFLRGIDRGFKYAP